MIPLYWAPEIFLHILSSNVTCVRYKVGNIKQSLVFGSSIVKLDDGTRDNVDIAFLGKFAIFVEIDFPLTAGFFELWVLRHPVQ